MNAPRLGHVSIIHSIASSSSFKTLTGKPRASDRKGPLAVEGGGAPPPLPFEDPVPPKTWAELDGGAALMSSRFLPPLLLFLPLPFIWAPTLAEPPQSPLPAWDSRAGLPRRPSCPAEQRDLLSPPLMSLHMRGGQDRRGLFLLGKKGNTGHLFPFILASQASPAFSSK
ncbi:hypothetical protein HJG60_008084 [Phyllostomus discolor]|uniref:Uncharacterized protein n=1 Tax=Phyllostomus discolor TaxID=89673 RepID=A0A834BI72_9CHIR|nr:hypothetical protein HJG60_008084 [Phyllostomus discolor]